jgi:hypothetical protein
MNFIYQQSCLTRKGSAMSLQISPLCYPRRRANAVAQTLLARHTNMATVQCHQKMPSNKSYKTEEATLGVASSSFVTVLTLTRPGFANG